MPLYLTEADVDALGDMELALKAVEGAFDRQGRGVAGMWAAAGDGSGRVAERDGRRRPGVGRGGGEDLWDVWRWRAVAVVLFDVRRVRCGP